MKCLRRKLSSIIHFIQGNKLLLYSSINGYNDNYILELWYMNVRSSDEYKLNLLFGFPVLLHVEYLTFLFVVVYTQYGWNLIPEVSL